MNKIGYSNKINYGKHTLSFGVSTEDFYSYLSEPKVTLSIDGSVVADPQFIGRPLYFDTPKLAMDYGKNWVDYRSGDE